MPNIDILAITPDREFRRIEPIYAVANTLNSAVDRMKASAQYIAADAIIEFRSAKAADVNGIETDVPIDLYICFGWAVKWVD